MSTPRINRNRLAFTVLELMVVVVIIAVLAALLLPALNQAKFKAQRISCVSHLMQVGMAFRIWSGDNHGLPPMKFYTNADGSLKFATATNVFYYFQVMSNELNTPKVLVCPNDKDRKSAGDFTNDFNSGNISYFVGLDADETRPAMLMAGDRNITNGAASKNGLLVLTTNQPAGWTMEMHRGNGNVGLADGSVQQLSNSRLRDAVGVTGTNVNRLLFP